MQVINNSCGTLAALNAVMNIPPQASSHPGESIALGVCLRPCPIAASSLHPLYPIADDQDELQNLKEFGSALTALEYVPSSSPPTWRPLCVTARRRVRI